MLPDMCDLDFPRQQVLVDDYGGSLAGGWLSHRLKLIDEPGHRVAR